MEAPQVTSAGWGVPWWWCGVWSAAVVCRCGVGSAAVVCGVVWCDVVWCGVGSAAVVCSVVGYGVVYYGVRRM